MGVDRTTEAISHFIGLFELQTAQGRLRDSYEEFTALRRKAELEDIEGLAADVRADFDMRAGDHHPLAVQIGPVAHTLGSWTPVHAWDGGAGGGTPPIFGGGNAGDDASGFDFEQVLIVRDPVPPPLMIPGSMLTVTEQTAALSDNDVLGHGAFRDAAEHTADLAEFAAVVSALHAPKGFGPAEIPTLADAEALADAMLSFSGQAPEGFVVHTFRGGDAPALIVNGEAAESAPEWKTLLPAYHREDEEGEAADDLEAWELPPGYTPDAETPEGHTIVAGGNLLVNQAQIGVSYLDAPFFAVGGKWINLDIISQVAAVSNHDTGAAATDAGRSGVYQVVEIEERSKTATWQAKSEDDASAAPKLLSVAVVTGDLFVSNYVTQTIEFFDNDSFGMSIEAANSAYILGDNTVFNVTGLVTAGLGYDLIIVGGDFITVDSITQSLVLLDDDWIEETFAPPDAPSGLFDTASATETAGEATAADGGRFAKDVDVGVEDGADEDTLEPAPSNLLMNHAKLTSIGTDTGAELSSALAEILSGAAPDLETLKEKLLTDPALAGLEHARVLKIDGSLIQSNTIEQIILASDRDDIRVDGAAPSNLEMIASSNALLNAASISTHGVDSQVMTGNDGYSDLLIHQASLIDEPDAPQEGDQALVSEAVAFLMEETESTVAGKTDEIGASGDTTSDAYDVMSSAVT